MTTMRQLIDAFLAEERALFATGLLGIGLAGMLGVIMLVHGPIIEPEARLFKAASFDFALGVYVITLGLLAPVAGFSRSGRGIWRWSVVVLVLISYGIETIQMLRGLDPRFTEAGSPFDQILGGVFFLIAQGVFVVFLVMAWKFFRHASGPESSLLVLGIRYGSVTTIAGFSIGYVMSALSGPTYGAAGNLLPLHAAGFHGLQAVPLVAVLLADSRLGEGEKRRRVHAAGIAWLALCAAIALQTFGGRPMLELSMYPLLATAAFSVWAITAIRSALVGVPALRHGTA